MATEHPDPMGSDAAHLPANHLRGAGDADATLHEPPAEAGPVPVGEAVPEGPGPVRKAPDQPESASSVAGPGGLEGETADEPLLGDEQAELRGRWQRIQGEFVDDPRRAVSAADALVSEVMQALARTFSDHKQTLEDQWQRGEEVATEDLRVALQRYRSFFHRLLRS